MRITTTIITTTIAIITIIIVTVISLVRRARLQPATRQQAPADSSKVHSRCSSKRLATTIAVYSRPVRATRKWVPVGRVMVVPAVEVPAPLDLGREVVKPAGHGSSAAT